MLLLLVLSLLAGPLEYMTHEGAHYLVARALGGHPTMHFDNVELRTHLDPFQNVLFTAAGPAADWAVGTGALVFLARRYTRWPSSLRSGLRDRSNFCTAFSD